jgi:hypothetical protein
MTIQRPSIKKVSVHRRYLGLSAIAKIKASKLKKSIEVIASALAKVRTLSIDVDEDKVQRLKTVLAQLYWQYSRIAFVDEELLRDPLPRCLANRRTFDSFTESEIRNNFRFQSKSQLTRLLECFDFPDYFYKGGHKYSGEETLVIGLYRLRYPNRLYDDC